MKTVLYLNKLILQKIKRLFLNRIEKYIDIQYIFSGVEIMEVENINKLQILKEYNSSLDFANINKNQIVHL